MKRLLLGISTLALLAAGALGTSAPSPSAAASTSGRSAATATPSPFRVMTYNIKTKDDVYRWTKRRSKAVAREITDQEPDIVGLQEVRQKSNKSLDTALAGYKAVRANIQSKLAIYYKTSRFEPVGKGWEAGKLDTPTSTKCPGARYIRADLRDKMTDKLYSVWSVHFTAFDCLDRRRQQAKAVLDLVAARPGDYKPIVLGDLNNATPKCSSTKKGEPITLLDGAGLDPTVSMKAGCGSKNATFNTGWNNNLKDDRNRWDYIFADGRLTPSNPGISKNMYRLKKKQKKTSASDHYAVYADLTDTKAS